VDELRSLKVRDMFVISLRAGLLTPFYGLKIFIFDDHKLGIMDFFKPTLDPLYGIKLCFEKLC
jgi:hypothetical protein